MADDDDGEDKLWDAIEILDERRGEYLIDWEGLDPATGKQWEPSWTLKSNVTPDLVAEWRKKKKSKQEGGKTANRRGSTSSKRASETPSRKRKASEDIEYDEERPKKRRTTRPASGSTDTSATKSTRDDTRIPVKKRRDSEPKASTSKRDSDDDAPPPPKRRARDDSDEERRDRKTSNKAPAKSHIVPKLVSAKALVEAGKKRRKEDDSFGLKRSESNALLKTNGGRGGVKDKVPERSKVVQGKGKPTFNGKGKAKDVDSAASDTDEVKSEEEPEPEREVRRTGTSSKKVKSVVLERSPKLRLVEDYSSKSKSKSKSKDDVTVAVKSPKAPAVKLRSSLSSKAHPVSPEIPSTPRRPSPLVPMSPTASSPREPGVVSFVEPSSSDDNDDGNAFNRRALRTRHSLLRKGTPWPPSPERAPLPKRVRIATPELDPASEPEPDHSVELGLQEEEEEEEQEADDDLGGGGYGQQLDEPSISQVDEPSMSTQSSSHGDDGSYRPSQSQTQTQTQARVEQEEEEEEEAEETLTSQLQLQEASIPQSSHDDQELPQASETQAPPVEEQQLDQPSQGQEGSQPSQQSKKVHDEDSYRQSQTQSSVEASVGSIVAETPPSQPAVARGLLPPPPPPIFPSRTERSRDKSKELKPVPYVSPRKFTPHLPGATVDDVLISQISEFTPSPERLSQRQQDSREELDEDEDEAIARRGAALAERERRAKVLAAPQRITLGEMMRRGQATALDGSGNRDDGVDAFINWDAAAPEPDGSIVQDTPDQSQAHADAFSQAEIVKLQEQLRQALSKIHASNEEIIVLKAELAASKSAPQPVPERASKMPVDLEPISFSQASVETSENGLEPGELKSSSSQAIQTELSDVFSEKAKLEETLALRDRTITSLRGEVDSLTSVYREASHAAARLAADNSDLAEQNKILQSQATYGVAQARALGDVHATALTSDLKRARAEVALLREQARLTGDVVRRKAGEYDRAVTQMDELRDALAGARRQVDDIGARNRTLQDEFDAARKTADIRMRALELELTHANERIVDLERDQMINGHSSMDHEEPNAGDSDVVYRCVWFTDALARCKQTFPSTKMLHEHVVDEHINSTPDENNYYLTTQVPLSTQGST